MKKLPLILAAISCMSGMANARSPRPQMDVMEAVQVATSSLVDISSYTATDIIAASVHLGSSTVLEIYNADTTYAINYGYESNVSTLTSSVSYGREILPKNSVQLQIDLDKVHVHAKTQNTTGTSPAVITKGRQ